MRWSPGPSGEIYLVNDSGKRGSIMEKALKLKRASVVKLTKNSDGELGSRDGGRQAGLSGRNQPYRGPPLCGGCGSSSKIHVYEIGTGWTKS